MAGQVTENSRYPGMEPVLAAIADWVKRYREARKARSELTQCSPDDVANIAHDLGVSSDELANLASKGADSARLLQKMLIALGVDSKGLALEKPAVMQDLQRLCVNCGHKRQCRHELAAGTAAEHYRDFCPNAYTLDALFQPK